MCGCCDFVSADCVGCVCVVAKTRACLVLLLAAVLPSTACCGLDSVVKQMRLLFRSEGTATFSSVSSVLWWSMRSRSGIHLLSLFLSSLQFRVPSCDGSIVCVVRSGASACDSCRAASFSEAWFVAMTVRVLGAAGDLLALCK